MRHALSGTASAIACSIALSVIPARGQPAGDIEVTVRGEAAGGYTSRTSTDDAPREPIDAASMLDELPSVHVRRLGPEGSFASISVRGSAPSQVGVVLGGIPLTSAADPAFDVGSLPLWPGASMRVFRGFAPAALGTTGYLGGVLAIDLPSPTLGERTEAWAAAGSFGGLKLRLGDLRRVGSVELGSGLFASRSDGDFTYPLQIPEGTGPIVQQTRTNAGQVVVGGIEHASITFPWGSVGALLFADTRRLGVPGTADAPTRFPTLSTSRVVPALDVGVRTGASGALHFLGWGRLETSDLYDPLQELDPTHTTTTKSTSEAAGLSVTWRGRPVDPITLGLVLDGRVEGFLPEASTGSLLSSPASRIAGGVGADVEWRATPRLTVSGSGRVDARRDDASGKSLDGTMLGVSGDVIPTGHLGASYRFADAAVVSAHGGALERPPGFQELYGNGASLLANPSLLPERALSADAGVHGDVGDGRARFGYEVVGFFTSASDLITFSPIGRGTFRAMNIARALLGGAEVTASFAAHGLRTQVTYTLLLTENRANGYPLPDRPEHDLVYDAAYQIGPVRVRYGLDLLAGDLYGSSGPPIPLPAHALHGVGASLDVPWARGLRVAVDVENLFDLRTLYEDSPLLGRPLAMPLSDFLGFPLPGRTVWATVRFSRPAL